MECTPVAVAVAVAEPDRDKPAEQHNLSMDGALGLPQAQRGQSRCSTYTYTSDCSIKFD